MKKAIMLLSMLFVFGNAVAHEGHAHKIMGAVEKVDASSVEIKTTDGTSSVTLTSKTMFHKGKAMATQSDVKVGEKIVVMCSMDEDGKMTATDVQLPMGDMKMTK